MSIELRRVRFRVRNDSLLGQLRSTRNQLELELIIRQLSVSLIKDLKDLKDLTG